jgi:hypothetical protein
MYCLSLGVMTQAAINVLLMYSEYNAFISSWFDAEQYTMLYINIWYGVKTLV